MESYQRLIDVISLDSLRMRVEHWVLTEVLVPGTLGQIAVGAIALALALLASVRARPLLERVFDGAARRWPWGRGLGAALMALSVPVLCLPAFLLAVSVAGIMGLPNGLLTAALKLTAAWVLLRLLSGVIRNAFLSRLAFLLAFAVTAASLLGLLEVLIVRLDLIGFTIGSIHLSVLDVLRGTAQVTLFVWAALLVAHLVENRVEAASGMAPSLRVLTSKLLRLTLITVALLFALTGVGIDITAFALVTGAFGVALGFGMQKTVSNLISGLLLLVDRSIKPGDVLELSNPADRGVQLFGWVTALNARYVSLTTRDGTEWLVPNEELISQRIVNWSYSHNRLRLLTPIAIDFESDVPLAMTAAVQAALSTPRVLHHPEPVCRLMSFGDSCVNLEMRFWIEDPTNGIINVRSDVLLAVWKAYRDLGIRTRLGHRDLHIKPDSELTLRMDRGRGPAQG